MLVPEKLLEGEKKIHPVTFSDTKIGIKIVLEGGVRVCSDAVLRYFWCGFAVIFILTCGITVSKH